MRLPLLALPALVAAALALSGPVAATRAATARTAPVLLRDVQASIDTLTGETGACLAASPPDGCFQNDAEAEPSIAVDPENPQHAIAVFHVGRANDGGAADDGYAVTFDAGRTWENGLFPGLTQASRGSLQRVSDPRIAFGPGGVAYATAQPYNNDVVPATSAVVSMTSTDGGRHWSFPVTLVQDDFSQNYPNSDAYLLNHGFDQPDLVVDLGSGAGHHRGRIYLTWVRLTLVDFVYAAYSDDGGQTWQKGPGGQGFVVNQGVVPLYPRPLVLGNGDLAVVDWNGAGYLAPPSYFGDPGPLVTSVQNQTGGYQIYIAAGAGSAAGVTPLAFGAPSTVAYLANNPLRGQRSAEKQPLVAVDAITGRLYVAWTDARFRTDAANDILLTYSDDRGATWRAPVRLDPGSPGDNLDHWCAMLVAGPDGVLRAAWRQRQEAADPGTDFANFSRQVDTDYTDSSDGGVTFRTPVRVSTVAGDMRYGAFDGGQTNVGQGGVFLGDYDAMATAGGLTYVVRAEAVAGPEAPAFPPVAHHQRTWVAVLGDTAPAAGGTTPSAQGATAGGLSNTAPGTVGAAAVAGAGGVVALGLAGGRRRRRRTEARLPGTEG